MTKSLDYRLKKQLDRVEEKLDKLSAFLFDDNEFEEMPSSEVETRDVIYAPSGTPGEYKLLKMLDDGRVVPYEQVDERDAMMIREEIDQERQYFWYLAPKNYPLHMNDHGFLDIRREEVGA